METLHELLEAKLSLLRRILDKTVAFRRNALFRPDERGQFADGYNELYSSRRPMIDELNRLQKAIKDSAGEQDAQTLKLGDEIDEVISGIVAIDNEMRAIADSRAKEARLELQKIKKTRNLNTAYMGGAYAERGSVVDTKK